MKENKYERPSGNKLRKEKREKHQKEQSNLLETSQMELTDQIEGRNSVIELLESGRDINKIFVQDGEKHGSINKIIAMASERKILINTISKEKMKQMAQTENYQGVIAIVPPFDYVDIEDILSEAKARQEDPFIVLLDGIEDPHNLGDRKSVG